MILSSSSLKDSRISSTCCGLSRGHRFGWDDQRIIACLFPEGHEYHLEVHTDYDPAAMRRAMAQLGRLGFHPVDPWDGEVVVDEDWTMFLLTPEWSINEERGGDTCH